MKIECSKLGRSYGAKWIIRNFSFEFTKGKIYGISGANGSGKSTLVKMLAGLIVPEEGQLRFFKDQKELKSDDFFKLISFAAPYQYFHEMIRVKELLDFHYSCIEESTMVSLNHFLDSTGLQNHASKKVNNLSSGMYQKLRLGLALFNSKPILILDEPTEFLDASNKEWFYQQLNSSISSSKKLCIIASNSEKDLEVCESIISIKAQD